LTSRVYKRFGPGVMMAEVEERNVGATGVPPPPLTNAELELRKAICACAGLASAITAATEVRNSVLVAFTACKFCARDATRAVKECAMRRTLHTSPIATNSCKAGEADSRKPQRHDARLVTQFTHQTSYRSKIGSLNA
jgi:hypothetical protein